MKIKGHVATMDYVLVSNLGKFAFSEPKLINTKVQ